MSPKGINGCVRCRAPTQRVLQVTLYTFDEHERYGSSRAGRKLHAAAYVARCYCEDCALAVYDLIAQDLAPVHDRRRGCKYCGVTPTVHRVEATMRSSARPQRFLRWMTIGLCATCHQGAYDAAIAELEP